MTNPSLSLPESSPRRGHLLVRSGAGAGAGPAPSCSSPAAAAALRLRRLPTEPNAKPVAQRQSVTVPRPYVHVRTAVRLTGYAYSWYTHLSSTVCTWQSLQSDDNRSIQRCNRKMHCF